MFGGRSIVFSIVQKVEMKSVNDAQYADVLLNIRSYFGNSETSIHKARNEIKIYTYKEDELVIKSFKIANLLNKFIYTYYSFSFTIYRFLIFIGAFNNLFLNPTVFDCSNRSC